MIGQNVKNFNLGKLKKTTVTASSGLLLLMTFAKDIGLIEELERLLSHLKKRRRGYSVSEKILSLFFSSQRYLPFLKYESGQIEV